MNQIKERKHTDQILVKYFSFPVMFKFLELNQNLLYIVIWKKESMVKSILNISISSVISCQHFCLFKGGVVVLHAFAWRIESVFAEFPTSLDPTPHPGGCIIGTQRESIEGFWTGLIFLVVLDPKPMEAKHLGLRTPRQGKLRPP